MATASGIMLALSAGISIASPVVRTMRRELGGCIGGLAENAGAGEVQALDAAGQHVLLIEIAAVKAKPEHVFGNAGARTAAKLDPARAGDVAGKLAGVHLDAPSVQQLAELGEIRRTLRHHHHRVPPPRCVSATGSTKARTLPPDSANWSMA